MNFNFSDTKMIPGSDNGPTKKPKTQNCSSVIRTPDKQKEKDDGKYSLIWHRWKKNVLPNNLRMHWPMSMIFKLGIYIGHDR